MKKGLKITAWILAAILILLLGLLVAVQSPAVQTALARKVVSLQKTIHEINDRYNGYFDTIYKISAIINRKYGKKIIEKAMTDNNAVNKIFIQPPFNPKE